MSTLEDCRTAYELGMEAGRAQFAALLTDLPASILRPYGPTRAALVAGRVSEMERAAQEFAQRIGVPYREWTGGTPAEAMAWCRNRDHAAYSAP